jgi:hypothetical protein
MHLNNILKNIIIEIFTIINITIINLMIFINLTKYVIKAPFCRWNILITEIHIDKLFLSFSNFIGHVDNKILFI